MNPFTFNTTPSIVFETGAAKRLGSIACKKLGGNLLFVTDPGLRKLGLCDPALASLEEAGARVTVFDSVEADPSLATLMKAVEAGRGVTGVIGFGGGSSMDVAKLAALLLGSGENLDEAWGVAQAKGPRLPLVLVPTTAGTGSEVTPVSIDEISNTALPAESSKDIAERVQRARALQAERFKGLPDIFANAQMPSRMVREVCQASQAGMILIKKAMEKLQLSARAYDRILKVARTAADLGGSAEIRIEDLGEAIHFRSLDREGWAG